MSAVRRNPTTPAVAAPLRAAVYVRQSLDREGTGDAVARQLDACRALIRDRGWELVETYADNDTSASTRKPRPGYVALLAAVRAGAVDAVVAWHVDRLTRSVVELESLVQLVEDTGVTVATCSGDVDLTNATGRLLGRMLASVARAEVERKGERHRAAHRQLAERGLPMPGVRAVGYEPDGVTVREPEAQRVRDAYAAVLAGGSLHGIARAWNEAGMTTARGSRWTTNSVRALLRSPRYAGLRGLSRETAGTTTGADGRPKRLRVVDVVGPAVWPALVDETTWRQVCAVLDDPSRRTNAQGSARRWLLPGLARCGSCGRPLRTAWRSASAGHAQRRRTYACLRANGGCGLTRDADRVDETVAAVLVERLTRPDAHVSRSTADVADAARAVELLTEQLRQVGRLIASGELDPVAGAEASRGLRAQLDAAARVTAAGVTAAPLPVVSDRAGWDALTLDQRRALIDALCVVTVERGEPGKPFDPATVRIAWRTADAALSGSRVTV